MGWSKCQGVELLAAGRILKPVVPRHRHKGRASMSDKGSYGLKLVTA
jgi:hypothetical protein